MKPFRIFFRNRMAYFLPFSFIVLPILLWFGIVSVANLNADDGANSVYTISVHSDGVWDIQGNNCKPHTTEHGNGFLMNCPAWTVTPTEISTWTPTNTPTLLPTFTMTPTDTPTPSVTPPASPTNTSSPTMTVTVTPSSTTTPTPKSTLVPSTNLLCAWLRGTTWNATWSDYPWDTRPADQFELEMGRKMNCAHWGQAWNRGGILQPFYPTDFNHANSRSYMPMLDWSTTLAGGGLVQPNFKLSYITGGAYDTYLTKWATDAKTWGKPFLLRLDWEMNGDWFVWSEKVNGNQAGDFVKMWRHIKDIFTKVGASNVKFVWCPNTVYSTAIPLDGLYPGDAYVDYVCADTYNYGGTNWRTFQQVYGTTYSELQRVAPTKPILLGEIGSTESGGNKAQWITQMFTDLPLLYPKTVGVLWFNWNDGHDWATNTSPESRDSFGRGARGW